MHACSSPRPELPLLRPRPAPHRSPVDYCPTEARIGFEYCEGKIYGSQLTEKGKEIWNDSKYNNWKKELGY